MADFFFYTDLEKLNAQSLSESFGPIDTNKYNITNKHTAISDTNAYAVTDGIICVQKQNGTSGLLNIILKPFYQPKNIVPVKYFIYRNIDPNSIIDPANTSLLAAATSNKLLSDIHNDSRIIPKSPTILGIELNVANSFLDTEPIDRLFFDTSILSSQLYAVEKGWSIGKFKSSGFSFEIHTDNVGFSPTLGFVRASNDAGILDITNSTSTVTSFVNAFEKQCAKEALYNFIDPVCFFGSIATNPGDTTNPGDRLFINNVSADAITEKSHFSDKTTKIFADFLSNLCNHNRNYIYIDLRDEHNSSYDYQRRYGILDASNIYSRAQLIFNSSDLQSPTLPIFLDYYNEFDWPLLRLNSDSQKQYLVNSSKTSLEFSISLPMGINKKALVYHAYGVSEEKKNLYENLKSPSIDPSISPPFTSYLTPIKIKIPIDINRNVISSYHQVKYIFEQIQVLESISPPHNFMLADNFFNDTSLNGMEPLDNVFQPFIIKENGTSTIAEETYYMPWNVNTQLNNTTTLLSNIYYDKTIIDTSRFSNKIISASKGVGIVNNSIINFFCHANENNETNDALMPDISPLLNCKLKIEVPDLTGTPTFQSYIYQYSKSISKNIVVKDLNILSYSYADITSPVVKRIERLDVYARQGVAPNAYSDFLNIDIAISDWSSIKNKAIGQANKLFLKNTKIFLGLKFIKQGVTQGILDDRSATRIRYIQYEIVLRGYIKDSTENKIILSEINNLGTGSNPVYYFYAINELDFNDFNKIQKRGNRHSINVQPISEVSDYTTDPIEEKHTIETELFLIRGAHVSREQYLKYLNYFKRNIRKIWNSATKNSDTFGNKGLVGLIVPIKVPLAIKKVRISTDETADTLGVQIKESASLNYKVLTGNQNFVYVTRSYFNRSFYSGNGLMYMIYDEQQDTAVNYLDNNVPAHEFGHLLGLEDRYAYIALAKFPQDTTEAGNANDLYFGITAITKDQFKVNPFYGKSSSLFLPGSYDAEYGINYGWHHNLMSTQTIVPNTPSLPSSPPVRFATGNYFDHVALDYEADYRSYFDNNSFRPTNLGATVTNDFDVVCVFITNTQWSHIYNINVEGRSIYEQNLFRHNHAVFIKNSDQVLQYPTKAINYFMGSFVGLLLTENDPAVVSSNPNYNPSFNTLNDITNPLKIHAYFQGLDNYFGNNNSGRNYPYALITDDGMVTGSNLRNMEKRILNTDSPAKYLNNIKAYVNPGYISDHIDPGPFSLITSLSRYETILDSNFPLVVDEEILQFLSHLEMGDNGGGLLIKAIIERERITNTKRNIKIKKFSDFQNPNAPFSRFTYFVDARTKEASYDYVLHNDDFSQAGEAGGKIIQWEPDTLERTIITLNENKSTADKSRVLPSSKLYNSGRLIWNYFEKTMPSQPYSLYSILLFGILSSETDVIRWNSYTNRNIILYIIQNGILDQFNNNNIFRNHNGYSYTAITDFNNDGDLTNDNQ